MSRLIKFLLILTIAAFLFTPNVSYSVEDAILAVVNDELITLSDLREYIKGVYVSLVAEGMADQQIKEIMLDFEINGLNKLIEDKLVLSKANELGLVVQDKLIDERVDEIKARYPDEQTFLIALTKNGASLTDLKNKIQEQLKIKFVIQHAVRSKLFVNPQEVTEYYNENISQFKKKEHIVADSIFIPYEKDKEETIKEANIALELIRSGEDFRAIAEQYSKTPAIGRVERGQLLSSIEKIVFHLPLNVASDVIETDVGIYIFLVKEKSNPELAPLEEVKDQITNLILEKKFRKKMVTWINKLKQESYVEVKH